MEKKKLQLNEFAIEITRKCNMKCAHCLRGEAQKRDIHKKYITKALEDISSIGTLTITGGEPTLNIPAIRFILEELKRLEIPVSNFYIVVNGRKTCQSVDFLHLLIEMYMYQDYKDEYLSMIQMSNDKYHSHPNEQRESKEFLSMLSFFSCRNNEYKMSNIISEGRGYDLGGWKSLDYSKDISINEDEDIIEVDSMIYLNAKGQVCNNCDYSYETQDEYYLFDINETSLFEGIKSIIFNMD